MSNVTLVINFHFLVGFYVKGIEPYYNIILTYNYN